MARAPERCRPRRARRAGPAGPRTPRAWSTRPPNYRGGTGHGRAWRRLSDRDLGGGDIQDIIAGGRWLTQNRHGAPGRLGAIGVSYGGYAVAHALEKAPDLWAVGVSIVGYFNWL